MQPFEPARLGPITLRNRTIKAATFEGRTRDGLVTPELIDFHRRVAAGGVGMTTVAYLPVSPEGRTDRHQVRAAVRLPMILLGGVTGRSAIDRALARGFEFVAIARALLRDPELINRIRADATIRSQCTHCNKCMPTIYSATRCVELTR